MRAMVFDVQTLRFLWSEVVNAANYLTNRSPINARSPPLACVCMHRVSLRAKGKTHQAGCSQHVKSVFVGYCDETKGYCFYNPTSRTITISGDAKFVEHGYWHTPDDSSSTPAVSLEVLSNKSAVLRFWTRFLHPRPSFLRHLWVSTPQA
jgi:hypothetical protein